jgi:hypothetical protein
LVKQKRMREDLDEPNLTVNFVGPEGPNPLAQ